MGLVPLAGGDGAVEGERHDDQKAAETAKLNDVDPQAWLADVLARLPDHPARRLDELLPWNWKANRIAAALTQPA